MPTLLNTKQAAQLIGMSASFLEKDRWAGAKIPFIKMGSRSVRYRKTDIDAYIEDQVRKSTSDKGE